jgi:hypothetical protein
MHASCWNPAGNHGPSGSGESWFELRRGNEARHELAVAVQRLDCAPRAQHAVSRLVSWRLTRVRTAGSSSTTSTVATAATRAAGPRRRRSVCATSSSDGRGNLVEQGGDFLFAVFVDRLDCTTPYTSSGAAGVAPRCRLDQLCTAPYLRLYHPAQRHARRKPESQATGPLSSLRRVPLRPQRTLGPLGRSRGTAQSYTPEILDASVPTDPHGYDCKRAGARLPPPGEPQGQDQIDASVASRVWLPHLRRRSLAQWRPVAVRVGNPDHSSSSAVPARAPRYSAGCWTPTLT